MTSYRAKDAMPSAVVCRRLKAGMARAFAAAACGAAMRISTCALAIAILMAPPLRAQEPESIRVFLVGDSTMASRTGYGDALCRMFRPTVTCINLARGGRSSGSFRAEGLWDKLLGQLAESSGYRATYVLIQFGHNDQPGKPGRSTDLVTEFPVNIARYVDDVKAAKALPILLTPLTRRMFRDDVLHNDLAPWAEATRRVAREKRVPLLDLNADSAAAVAAMGPTEANSFAMASPPEKNAPADKAAGNARFEPDAIAPVKFDYTHLGEKGANFFSTMVARELIQTIPSLAVHLKPSGTAK